MHTTQMVDSDLLTDVLSYSEVLTELREESLTREEVAQRLDVSSSTTYRYVNRLDEMGLVGDEGKEIHLTQLGQTIASSLARFETTVDQTLPLDDVSEGTMVELLRYSPALLALTRRPLRRRELEDRLGVSDSTGYRITRTLEEMVLIEKTDGRYEITHRGAEVLEAVSEFEANVQTAVRLGPVTEVLRETGPDVDLDAFADATVTDVESYTFSPQIRFLELLDKTDAFLGIGTESIVPGFFVDIQERIIDGMELEVLWTPETTAKSLAKWPERMIEVCGRKNVSVYLHEDIGFDLAIFDHRVGVGVPDTDTGVCRVFVDTESTAARAWAEEVYESTRADAVRLPRFDPASLQRAVEKLPGDEARPVEQR